MTVLLDLTDPEFRVLSLYFCHPRPCLREWLAADDELGDVVTRLGLKFAETSATLAYEYVEGLEGEERKAGRLLLGRDTAQIDQIRAAIAEEGAP